MSAVSQSLTSTRPIQSAESEPPRMKVLMAEDSTPMRILLNSQLSGWGARSHRCEKRRGSLG